MRRVDGWFANGPDSKRFGAENIDTAIFFAVRCILIADQFLFA